jgi:hypothetical protein
LNGTGKKRRKALVGVRKEKSRLRIDERQKKRREEQGAEFFFFVCLLRALPSDFVSSGGCLQKLDELVQKVVVQNHCFCEISHCDKSQRGRRGGVRLEKERSEEMRSRKQKENNQTKIGDGN